MANDQRDTGQVEPRRLVIMPVPIVRPLGTEFTPEYTQEVWDAFVKPDQDAGNLQSVEMRMLMALLRAYSQGAVQEEVPDGE